MKREPKGRYSKEFRREAVKLVIEGGVAARYATIKKLRKEHSIPRLCEILDVSASGYYIWLNRPLSRHGKVVKIFCVLSQLKIYRFRSGTNIERLENHDKVTP